MTNFTPGERSALRDADDTNFDTRYLAQSRSGDYNPHYGRKLVVALAAGALGLGWLTMHANYDDYSNNQISGVSQTQTTDQELLSVDVFGPNS